MVQCRLLLTTLLFSEAYAISGQSFIQSAASFVSEWIVFPTANAKQGVGGSTLPELALLLERALEHPESSTSLQLEELNPSLLDTLTSDGLLARRLSGGRCASRPLHILEAIQWIEHAAHYAQLAGTAGTVTLMRVRPAMGMVRQGTPASAIRSCRK